MNAFLAKFSSGGELQWATYYGGSGKDYSHGISMDGSGNVYITGETTSASGIATSGAHLTSYGGSDDAFLAKFSSSGAMQWASYYGGSFGDVANGVSMDGSGNVYITGYTASPSGIATNGAYQTSLAGSYDAFLAKFSSGGGLLWSTYYGGSSSGAFGVCSDLSGNIYMTGYTSSDSGVTTSGSYQTYFAGTLDAFFAKFKFRYATDIDVSGKNDNYSLSVFPNPFHGTATVKYSLPEMTGVKISLYDLNGRILGIVADKKQEAGTYQLDISAEKYHLTPGVYLLKFMAGDAVENKRIEIY